uniref:MACPF domain-containing protein n=1 Tax=Magallana gigas TaxID=29159 RepID=K1QXH4_MAGGI|eukprot:XP_011423353.2 PREDICTED: macrophage-expressed gene 1 protein [Crassostrea gigas]
MFTLVLVLYLFGLTTAFVNAEKPNFINGDPRTCYDGKGEKPLMFEVLPGFGWDNLVNENRGVVVNFNYSKCKTTEDRRYLLPDGIVTIPVKTSQMNVFSKLYDHWSQYESDTANSINIGASGHKMGVKIAASFSSEHEHIRKHQLEDKSFTTKVQVKFVRYTAKVLPDIQLDQSFRNRLLKIAGHIHQNRKSSTKYESELLVRDFGTHVLTSVDAGASIVKVDQVDSSFLKDTTTNRENIGFSASISLPGIVSESIKNKFSNTKLELEKYMKNVKNSDIRTYGGPPMNPENFTLSEWTTTIGNDLVAVDRNGFPLDYVISTTTFPELSESLVEELVQSVRKAILSYFKHNTYPGCTNPNAPNFSKISNLDDGSCHEPFTNLSFGGVYQECNFHGTLIDNENMCDSLATNNPQTQAFACPEGFEKVPLHEGITHKSQHQHQCRRCWAFFHCCHDQSYYASATYKSFWCRAKPDSLVREDIGFLFGGLYSDRTTNFVTQTKSCPQFIDSE